MGREAGARTVAVTSGVGAAAELAPYADVVLGSIGELLVEA
jgi:phosphoglycolate phosphatase-like HAD superfamily hydrolase